MEVGSFSKCPLKLFLVLCFNKLTLVSTLEKFLPDVF